MPSPTSFPPAVSKSYNATGPISKDVITYDVIVKDQYHSKAFKFVHRVPSALHLDLSDLSALDDLMDSLINEHHQELVDAYPWRCLICQKPATSIAHHTISELHAKDNPRIVGFTAPICVEDSHCHGIIAAGVNNMFTGLVRDMDNQYMQKEKRNTCAHCNNKSKDELKRCGKCKNVSYCSRDCQAADWPKHKMDCTKNDSK